MASMYDGKGTVMESEAKFGNDFPVYSGNVYADENLVDSRPLFRTLRDLGDAVWVPALNMFVVARYKDVITALRAPDKLISSQGVSLNAEANALSSVSSSTILSDGEKHRHYRKIELRPLTPAAVGELRERIDELASRRVAELATGETFEAVRNLAAHLPLTIVAEMVGVKGVDNDKMLAWSNALFDAFCPSEYIREDSTAALSEDFYVFTQNLKREDLEPKGWAAQLFEAADRGEITHDEARGLMGDYLVPSLDTTIYASAQMLFSLATVSGAWEKLRANPQMISAVVDEAVRLASPLRGFTRVAVEDFKLSESTIPSGSRVWLLYGAANLDERKYPDPEVFDVERNPRDHLGWGHGVHLCGGKPLARLEMEALLRALLKHVDRLEADAPKPMINSAMQGFGELNMRLTAR